MIVCKKCGNQNEEGATFCGSCGGFLEWLGEKIADPSESSTSKPPPSTSTNSI